MVDVAQLVEPRVVIPAVVGSSPIVHPNLESAESAAGDFLRSEERAKVTSFARGQKAPQATFCNRIRAVSSAGRAGDS
jgi:hypothetical protein